MVSIISLWLPIVVSSVVVFVASWLLHMLLTYHRKDYGRLPDEAKALDALRGIPPGYYFFPYCASPKEMGTPEAQEKFKKGPVGMLSVMPSGPPTMGKHLLLWFLFLLLVGVFVAYLTGRTLGPGAEYLAVFRIAGTVAFAAYGLGLIPWSPLAGGLWGGAFQKLKVGRRAEAQKEIKKRSKQLKAYEALCEELGEQPADVALAWLLANPAVTAPIIGPRTLDQLNGSLRALEIKLEPETLKQLDEIWPGPGGEAPEAFAW